MKKALYLSLLFLLFSCEVHYNGDARYIIKTKVVDKNGNPIPDIQVEIIAENDNVSDPISYTTTDEDGFSIQIFPPLKSSGTFNIDINSENSLYQRKSIRNIKESDFQDLLFDFGTITLLKKEDIINFQIKLIPLQENYTIENITIDAIQPNEIIYYNEPLEEYYYPETYFRIVKNQSFTISYSIRDYNTNPTTLTNYSVSTSVGNESVTYQLEY